MKSLFLFGVVSMIILSSCGMPSTNNTAPAAPVPTIPDVQYPTSQQDTPATKFCTDRGGVVSIEPVGGVDMAYCTTKTGEKIDAWKYMNDETNQGETGKGE